MKYQIRPKKNLDIVVGANSADEAIIRFATDMDTDMNLYFEAVPATTENQKPWTIVKKSSGKDGFDAVELGQLHITSGKVTVTDPCYNSHVWCRMNDVPVVPGDYTCVVRYVDKGEWGIRVAKIGIYRDSDVREDMDLNGIAISIGTIGVDAGLAGIFEEKTDFSDDQWHDFCDDIFTGDAWIAEGKELNGFFSSSGYGDGEYVVYGHPRHSTNAWDGIEVIFLENSEDEEDEDDD